MNRIKRTTICLGVVGFTLWITGCSSTSPVLLQLPSERGGTAEIPLKVGITSGQRAGEQKVSTIDTCAQYGLWHFYAKMPRRSELNYFNKSIGDFFRDTKAFTYCYDEPFDRNDVNIVVRVDVKDLKIDNTALGTTIQTINSIPYLGLCGNLYTLLGGPIETFVMSYNLELIIETPAGKELSRYQFSGSGREGVNVYEQPFGNYLWYNSVFQKEFFKAMDYFVSQMKKDRDKIMQAAGK